MNPSKAKTIDEVCKQPEGSFAKFIQQKENFQRSLEAERKERICAARQLAEGLSWAA